MSNCIEFTLVEKCGRLEQLDSILPKYHQFGWFRVQQPKWWMQSWQMLVIPKKYYQFFALLSFITNIFCWIRTHIGPNDRFYSPEQGINNTNVTHNCIDHMNVEFRNWKKSKWSFNNNEHVYYFSAPRGVEGKYCYRLKNVKHPGV